MYESETGLENKIKMTPAEIQQNGKKCVWYLSKLVVTVRRLSVVVVDVVLGFILPVLMECVLTGHAGDDGQVSGRGLGHGRITHIQQELAVVDDSRSCNGIHKIGLVKYL